MKKLVFGVVLFCLCGLLWPLSVSAADEAAYTEEQEEIYAKVDELARMKALGTPLANTDHIERCLNELNNAGAIPDDELLAELIFDKSFRRNGMRIENMADFREAHINVLDIFAVQHTATVLHRDYEVCEIIIQEVVRDRSGSLNMFEILSTSSYRHVFTNAATEPTWRENFIRLITKGTDSSPTIKNDIASGYSRSFTVQTVLQPTLHMIFVKRYGSTEWVHTLTTHSIALLEYYDWHYVTNENYGTIHSKEQKIEDILQPSGYDTSIYDAITAYRREITKPEFEARP